MSNTRRQQRPGVPSPGRRWGAGLGLALALAPALPGLAPAGVGAAPPTGLELVSTEAAPEVLLVPGAPAGTAVAVLLAVDPDQADTHTFTLAVGPGDGDNALFGVEGDLLILASPAPVDRPGLAIRLRVTDPDGLWAEAAFSVPVDPPQAPAGAALDVGRIATFAAPGSGVGNLVAADPNRGDRHAFALVEGDGADDNALFSIDAGGALVLEAPVPGGREVLSIRVRVSDLAGLSWSGTLALPVVEPAVTISEFVAESGGRGLEDEDGDFPDWVEIHNTRPESVNLAGWYLTDDPADLKAWTFPPTPLAAGGRAVVFASGKDRYSLLAGERHTNFRLGAGGEFLALVEPDGTTVADQYAPAFPEQEAGVAYGVDAAGRRGFLDPPTPGAENGTAAETAGLEVVFATGRGFFEAPFSLQLAATLPEAEIIYTTDGSEPVPGTILSPPKGTVYTGPITIGTTTSVRAVAALPGRVTSAVVTQSYFFVEDLLGQPEMDAPMVNSPVFGPQLRAALTAIPMVSIVSEEPVGKSSEVVASVEFIDPSGAEVGFQIDCGIKRVGGHSLNAYPKNNMRLYFRGEYGAGKLRYPLFPDHPYSPGAAEEFDQLNLRSGSHDSVFYLGAGAQPGDAQYIRNRWMNDMQFLMGHESLHGRWVHVAINGTYWGHYQLMERPTAAYLASYLGGSEEDYEATNSGRQVGGSPLTTWSAILGATGDYPRIKLLVDVENLVDYMVLNHYAGNTWDWNPSQNWMAAGPDSANRGGYKFFAWDSDIILQNPGNDNLGKTVPQSLFHNLLQHEEFKVLLADRIFRHCFNDGLLTPGRAAETYNFRAEEIRPTILVETARWSRSWTRDGNWQRELDRLNRDFFPGRTETLLGQYRAQGWYPDTRHPVANQHGGAVPDGFQLTLRVGSLLNPHTGTIYYTLDGGDPRLPGGGVAPGAVAFESGLRLDPGATRVMARNLEGEGWSPLVDLGFVAGDYAVAGLRVSELHYRPAEPDTAAELAVSTNRDDYEFIELYNAGGRPLGLAGLRFIDGIDFAFGDGARLEPGAYAVLVKSAEAFAARYGAGVAVAGEFSGNLRNSGERLALRDLLGQEAFAFEFKDGWFPPTDGGGYALALRHPGAALPGEDALSEATSWGMGARPGGSPGAPEPFLSQVFEGWRRDHFDRAERDDDAISGERADADGDGLSNLIEYALGTDPRRGGGAGEGATPLPHLRRDDGGGGTMTFSYRRWKNATDLAYQVEVSRDLGAWAALDPAGGGGAGGGEAGGEETVVDHGDGTETVSVRVEAAAGEGASFVRLRVARLEP